MLASTVQFSTYDQPPTTLHRQTHTPTGMRRYARRPALTEGRPAHDIAAPGSPDGPLPQDPTARLRTEPHGQTPLHAHPQACSTRSPRRGPAELVSVPPSSTTPDTRDPSRLTGRHGLGAALHHQPTAGGEVLLRKEVIQPHLPVRLPCYDFVPIADPAFDGSLHKGWATGFGRYRLS